MVLIPYLIWKIADFVYLTVTGRELKDWLFPPRSEEEIRLDLRRKDLKHRELKLLIDSGLPEKAKMWSFAQKEEIRKKGRRLCGRNGRSIIGREKYTKKRRRPLRGGEIAVASNGKESC